MIRDETRPLRMINEAGLLFLMIGVDKWSNANHFSAAKNLKFFKR